MKHTDFFTRVTHASGWTSRLHELQGSKVPFVSRIEFVRSKFVFFSAHVTVVTDSYRRSSLLRTLPVGADSCAERPLLPSQVRPRADRRPAARTVSDPPPLPSNQRRSQESQLSPAVRRSAVPAETPDSRLPTPDSRLPTPDSRLPTPDSRLPTPDSRLPTPDSGLPTPDSGLPAPGSRLPAPGSRPSATDSGGPPLPVLSAPSSQANDWTLIAELTGSKSPVRAASALAICSWLGLTAVGGSSRAKGKLTSVERGAPCPAMWAR